MLLTIFIAIVIFFVVLFFIYNSTFFKKKKEKYGDSLTLFLPIILTFIISIPTYYWVQEKEVEKSQSNALSLMEKAYTDVYECRQETISIFFVLKKDIENGEKYWYENQLTSIHQPSIFINILDNETVLLNINQEITESMRSFKNNSNFFIDYFSKDSISVENLRNYLYNYGKIIWQFEEILKISIEYLDGELDDQQFDKKKFNILNEYYSSINNKEYLEHPYTHPWLKVGK